MAQVALAPCSPFSVTTSLMRATAELARKHRRAPAHASRRDRGREPFCHELYGCRPLDYLEDLRLARRPTWLAHGIHFSAEEMPRLAKAGVSISHCACSNQTLASGHCPVCELEAAGVGSASASTARPPTTSSI